MSRRRPKVLIQADPNGPAGEAAELLRQRFDVVEGGTGPGPKADEVSLVLRDAIQCDPTASEPGPPRSLLDSIGEGVCLAGTEGELIWTNRRFDALNEEVRARVATVCRKAARWFQGQVDARAARADAGVEAPERDDTGSADRGDPWCRHFQIETPGNEHFEVLVSAVWDGPEGEGASLNRVAAVVRDVSEPVQARRMMDAIDLAGAELVRIDADSVRGMDLFERLRFLENKIIRYLHELMHFDQFAVRLVDEQSGRLEPVITSGFPRESLDLELYRGEESGGICGYVAATGKSYLCADTEQDVRYLPGAKGARSSLTVPLRLHDRVIGVLDVESDRPGAFTDDDRQFAEIFARYIAMALNVLDVLVVERSSTNQTVSGMVEGQLREPLEDIIRETDLIGGTDHPVDQEVRGHIDRIRKDVDAIRRRVRDVASGPQTILGVDGDLERARPEPMLVGRRVMVVDDHRDVRRMIADVLRRRGSEVVVCANGTEACEAIERVAAGADTGFDLILSDIKLPDRNGYEIFAAARRAMPDVPVILMTGFGYDPHHSIVRASQEGLRSVLFKPFQVDRLIDEIRAALADSKHATGSN